MAQLTVKLVGFAIALPLALAAAGGWSAVTALTPPAADYWDFWSGGSSGLVYIALLSPAFVVSPGLLQKLYGARDDRAVTLGVGWNAVGLFLYAIIPVLLGMIARVRFPELTNPDLALPTILLRGLPSAIGTLGLAAVFSAELSAADAVLFILTTSLSQDLYKRFVVRKADDRHILAVARVTTVVAGAIGTAIAVVSPSIIGVLSIFYTLLGVSLFVPRAGTVQAMGAIVAGVGVMLAVHLSTAGKGYGWVSPALLGLAAASAAFFALLILRKEQAV
jgi:SSS family solute:Na+ symporter